MKPVRHEVMQASVLPITVMLLRDSCVAMETGVYLDCLLLFRV